MNRFKNIIILFHLSYLLSLMGFIFKYADINYGLSIYPYQVYLGLLFPALFFIYKSINDNKLKLPYFILFIFVELLFIILELRFFDDVKQYNLAYPWYIFVIYTNFIILVNYGISKRDFQYIIESSVYIILVLTSLQYASFLGLIGSNSLLTSVEEHISKIVISNNLIEMRYGEIIDLLIHPNGASIICGVAVLLVIICRKKLMLFKNNFLFLLTISYFLLLVVLNATRGVFLVTSLILIIYYFRKVSFTHQLFHFSIIVLLSIMLFNESAITEKLTIANRLSEINPNQARANQIKISFFNFLQNPLFGLGYNYAASANEYYNSLTLSKAFIYTRSNFSYTQILSSHGIFYFIIYMTFLFKMWGANMNNFTKLSILIFSFGSQMFYNWALLESLAVLAYINFYEKRTSRLAIRV